MTLGPEPSVEDSLDPYAIMDMGLDSAVNDHSKDTVLVLLTYRLIFPDNVDKVYVQFSTNSGQGDILSQEIPKGGPSEAPYLVYPDGKKLLDNRTDAQGTYRFKPVDWNRVKKVGVYYKDKAGINSSTVISYQ